MVKRIQVLLWLVIASAVGALAGAQGRGASEVQVTAGLQSGVIKLGERTSIVVSIERSGTRQAPATQPFGDMPVVDGLVIGAPSGPSTSSFSSMVGRSVTTTVSQRWVIPVRPTRAGEFNIPQFELKVDDKNYVTPVMRLKVVEDMQGAELGFLEVTASSRSVVEGQPFTIEVRFGWDEALNGVNFADLSLGFWDGIPGAIDVENEFPAPNARRIERGVSVNGGRDVVVEELDPVTMHGRTFRQLRILRSYLPTRGGRIEIQESFLNFGRLEERGSFFDRRTVKAEDYYVGAPTRWVDVKALPEEGRPIAYTGAVGEIDARADVDRRDVDQGESIKLTVEWTGAGNLEFFDAPELDRIDGFEGFRVYGRTDDKSFDRRTVVYDIAPIELDTDFIPGVPLIVYDPTREEYVTVSTPEIPIRVRALAGAVELEDEEEAAELARDLRDIDPRPLRPGAEPPWAPARSTVLAILFGVPILGLCVRGLARRRGDPSAPANRRRRAARRELARALQRAAGPEDELRALYRFLAARTGETEEAWTGRDVAARASIGDPRLFGGRADTATTNELAETIARLETAVWSGRNGSAARVPNQDVLGLADRLMKEGL